MTMRLFVLGAAGHTGAQVVPPREAPRPSTRMRDAFPAGARAMSFRAAAAFLLDRVERGARARKSVGLAGAGGGQ